MMASAMIIIVCYLVYVGVTALKFGRRGSPHEKYVSLSDNLQWLEWRHKPTDIETSQRRSKYAHMGTYDGEFTCVS